jgi:hypothetical protein
MLGASLGRDSVLRAKPCITNLNGAEPMFLERLRQDYTDYARQAAEGHKPGLKIQMHLKPDD